MPVVEQDVIGWRKSFNRSSTNIKSKRPFRASANAAAALPNVDVTKPQAVIGTNTVACMQSGVFWGYVGLVREISDRIKDEYGSPMRVIGTGGLSSLFDMGGEIFDALEPDLTMHGLVLIYEHNKALQ